MSKACVAGMTRRQGRNRGRLSKLYEIYKVEAACWDSYAPEILWVFWRELDQPCPSSKPMEITSKSRARCSLGSLSATRFQCKTKYSTYVSACPPPLPFHSPTQEINLFSPFFVPFLFFFIS